MFEVFFKRLVGFLGRDIKASKMLIRFSGVLAFVAMISALLLLFHAPSDVAQYSVSASFQEAPGPGINQFANENEDFYERSQVINSAEMSVSPANTPIFRVYPQHNWISSVNEWEIGKITLEIYDGDELVFERDTESDSEGYFYFNLWDDYASEPLIELKPGLEIIIQDQFDYSTSHIIKDLEVKDVDIDNYTISGLADGPGSEVVARVWNVDGEFFGEATADSDRKWEADFSGKNIDHSKSYEIRAFEADSEGNKTIIFWYPPVVRVNPADNSIWGHDWPCDTELTITVNGLEYTVQTGEGWDWIGCTDFSLQREDLEFEAGAIIAVTDGESIKEHTATALRDVYVDMESDTVSGYAEPGSTVGIEVYHGGPLEIVTADDNDGSWSVQFPEDTINPGTDGNAHQRDDGWNQTHVYWRIVDPFYHVDPQYNYIWGHDWQAGSEISVTIKDNDDLLFSDTVDVNEYGDFSIDLMEKFNILPGYDITVTDGITAITHTVTELIIWEVHAESNTVSGTAAVDTTVEVEIFVEEGKPGPRRLVKAEGAFWEADFSIPGAGDCPSYEETFDILPDTHGFADQYEDRSSTRLHFNRAGASITGRVVDDDETPISGASINADKIKGNDFKHIGFTSTDQEGNYQLQGFDEGSYHVSAVAPGKAREYMNFSYPDQDQVDFVLETGGSISGTITDIDGNPLKGAHVSATLKVEMEEEDWDDWHWWGGADSNAEGYYKIDGLPPGQYGINAHAEGYISKTYDDTYVWELLDPVEVVAGETTDGIDLMLEPVVVRENEAEAIKDGVAWLVGEQNPDGSWGSEQKIAKTALSLYILNYHAHEQGLTSLDENYEYHGAAESALHYLCDQTRFRLVDKQAYYGRIYPRDNRIYKTAIAMMGIVSTGEPFYLIENFQDKGDWTLEEIAIEITAYLEYAQHKEEGGWSYGPIGRSDQSNAGWVTLALAYGEDARFNFDRLLVPGQIRDDLEDWVTDIQVDDEGSECHGGSLYTLLEEDVHMGANALRTGNLLQQMAFLGDIRDDDRLKAAVAYLERVWDYDHDPHEYWIGDPTNYHATYTIMKGLVALEEIEPTGEVNHPVDHFVDVFDWYGHLSEVIRDEQSGDGYWRSSIFDRHEGNILSTQWALMTLQKAAAETKKAPNMSVEGFEVIPSNAWDRSYTVNFKVVNRGNTAMTEDTDARLYIDDELKQTFDVEALAPRAETPVFSHTTSLDADKADISIVIDEDNNIEELRKDNNYVLRSWPTAFSGIVKSSDEGNLTRLSGAKIEALNNEGEVIATAESARDGSYAISGLPTGDYSARATAEYHEADDIASITVEVPTATEEQNFILERVSKPVDRLYGLGRYETAAELTREGWEQADTVLLASGESYPDALAGVPLAYKLGAPIMLTRSGELPESTRKEILRLKAESIIILGGNVAVSEEVENELKEIVATVERIGGNNRYETAALIAEEVAETNQIDEAFIAFGEGFPDALAAASYAARRGSPILLTRSDSLPEATANLLAAYNVKSSVVVGGPVVIESTVKEALPAARRIDGPNRYLTALELAKEYLPEDTKQLFIATGDNFPDALAGGALAATRGTGILLVPGHRDNLPYPFAPAHFITEKGFTELVMFGGQAAIGRSIYQELYELLN